MKELRWEFLALAGLLACGVAGGCSRNDSTRPLEVRELPTLTTNLFAESPPEARQVAHHAAEALQSGRYAAAWTLYNQLVNRPDLTPEQRRFAHHALTATAQAVARAAEQGDSEAERALRNYRATK
jgi:hypothetical protein